MHRKCLFFALVTVIVTGNAAAQSSTTVKGPEITGRTPAECVKGASDWQVKEWTAVPAAGKTAALNTAMRTESQRIAKECGAKLALDKTPSSGLNELLAFYTFVGDTTLSRTTLARALSASDLPVRE